MIMMLRPTISLWIIPIFLVVLMAHELEGLSVSPSRSATREAISSSSVIQMKATSESDNISAWNQGGKVAVTIVKEISPECAPTDVLDAWMEHHWRRGGGLPIFISTTQPKSSFSSSTKGNERIIYPIAMTERILSSENNLNHDKDDATVESSIAILRYQVLESGPIYADVVPGSHLGIVTFSPGHMIWKVEFETTQLQSLYQKTTEFTVGVAARTVQEACGPTRLFTLQAKIPKSTASLNNNNNNNKTSTTTSSSTPLLVELRRELLEFFWSSRGGGLPLLPPIPYGDVLKEGGGMARSKMLRIPPLITESIVSATITTSIVDDDDDDQEIAEIVYRLEDPGWLTFPFLLHTHLGRVKLLAPPLTTDDDANDNNDNVQLEWQVEIRPYYSFPSFAAPAVEKLVEMVIATIVRNFLVHLQEPGATIPLGEDDLLSGIRIPKASWLGGVIVEKRQNAREEEEDVSALDKFTSVMTPWNWGRTGNGKGDNDDALTYSWMDNEKIKLQ